MNLAQLVRVDQQGPEEGQVIWDQQAQQGQMVNKDLKVYQVHKVLWVQVGLLVAQDLLVLLVQLGQEEVQVLVVPLGAQDLLDREVNQDHWALLEDQVPKDLLVGQDLEDQEVHLDQVEAQEKLDKLEVQDVQDHLDHQDHQVTFISNSS